MSRVPSRDTALGPDDVQDRALAHPVPTLDTSRGSALTEYVRDMYGIDRAPGETDEAYRRRARLLWEPLSAEAEDQSVRLGGPK